MRLKLVPEETSFDFMSVGKWAAGLSIAASGLVRDVGGAIAQSGVLGEGMNEPAIGYLIVYHIEIALLFAALLALGPLVREDARTEDRDRIANGLAGRTA